MAFLPHECMGLGNNVCILLVIVVLHIAFLAIEMLAVHHSHSLSLLSDVLHSGLDVGTFAINLLAEYHISEASRNDEYHRLDDKFTATESMRKKKLWAERWEMIGVTTTAGALLISTFYVLYEAFERLANRQPNHEIDEHVLIWIVVPMVVLNGLVLLAFYFLPGLRGCPHHHSHSHGHSHGGVPVCSDEMSSNMFSAFSHVLADQLQNVALLVIALLVKFKIGDPIIVDAVGSVLTGVMTAVVAFAILQASWRKATKPVSSKLDHSTPLMNRMENGSQERNGHCHTKR